MNIFITRPIPKAGIDMLKKKQTVTLQKERRNLSKKEMIAKVKGKKYDAILCLLTNKIDADVMDAAGPQLKVLSNYAVGFDNIDVEAAKKRKIVITNTPSEEISISVAEHTFTLMLALSRRIVEADRFARAGKYMGWDPDLLIGQDFYDKTVGLLGMGRIGKEVVKRARLGFGATVLYYDLHRDLVFEKESGVKYAPQEKLLRQSDIVSLHVPLLPSTRHLISTKALRLMKKTALLINTARGPIVDEKAVLKALYAKKIGGYALDVFECEPEIDCDPTDQYELKKLDNVIMTPHIASATRRSRDAMARLAAQNILDVLAGKTPAHVAK
ncbi:D-glycerate dehydrogenase [Candidatus Uhrbacteria bacterium]|nr:D-glycerate dehydrogenase [Candidatus Uhrbacteria bacterium]